MSRAVYDLAARRIGPAAPTSLLHPAGLSLPFDQPADAELITPEIRADICSGAYSADLLQLLPSAVRPGDRVLIIGAGLCAVSTAVLADNKHGRVPFFARRDLSASSLLPDGQPWQTVIMVPFMGLSLILAEERISLMVCSIPRSGAQMIGSARLDGVDRVIVDCGNDAAPWWEEGELCSVLAARCYVCSPANQAQVPPSGTALLFQAPRPGCNR